MKKLLIVLLITAFCLCGLTACKSDTQSVDDGKLKVISTIFPGYDFARQVCGENAEISMLLPPGSESHSYEPTPKDIKDIQECDLFIYVGGESDSWVDDIIASLSTPVRTLKMMECVTAVEEKLVEGMQEESGEEEHHDEDEKEYDEHVWTSPVNAVKITRAIASAVIEEDKENEAAYTSNTNAYVAQLEQLDKDFKDFFATVSNKTMIFGDRFPFRYFADEYGIDYYAAFPGCSNETEPSAATIAFLIEKVKTENLTSVFYIEFSKHLVADTIAESTGAKTALFHSCHNVSDDELNNGATYLSLMKQNLETLKTALK